MGDLDWRVVRELMALGSRLREVVEKTLLPGSPVAMVQPSVLEPPVDVWEADHEVIVEAELPGVRGADLELRLEGNSLLLGGTLPEAPESGGTFLRVERARGQFRRIVPLPAEVAGQPHATLHSGVLQVRLPKADSAGRRVGIVTEGA